MLYRMIIAVIALILVVMLFALMWAGAAALMKSQGHTERLMERSRIIALWTFAGFGIGLLFMGFGGPILATAGFYRAARGVMPEVPEAKILLWGLATVVLSSLVAGGILVGTLLALG